MSWGHLDSWRESSSYRWCLLRACDSLNLVLSTDRSLKMQNSPIHLSLCTCACRCEHVHIKPMLSELQCLSGDIEETPAWESGGLVTEQVQPLVHWVTMGNSFPVLITLSSSIKCVESILKAPSSHSGLHISFVILFWSPLTFQRPFPSPESIL